MHDLRMDQTLSSLCNRVTYVIVFRMLRDVCVFQNKIGRFTHTVCPSHSQAFDTFEIIFFSWSSTYTIHMLRVSFDNTITFDVRYVSNRE